MNIKTLEDILVITENGLEIIKSGTVLSEADIVDNDIVSFMDYKNAKVEEDVERGSADEPDVGYVGGPDVKTTKYYIPLNFEIKSQQDLEFIIDLTQNWIESGDVHNDLEKMFGETVYMIDNIVLMKHDGRLMLYIDTAEELGDVTNKRTMPPKVMLSKSLT